MAAVAEGTVRVPGSKSVTHRAFVLAAQSDRPCTVARPLRGADTDATLACLHALGARFTLDDDAVRFLPADLVPPTTPLDCRNAGTALRLLTAAAARQAFPVAFTGDASLRTRPNAPLHAALRGLGATVTGDGTAPFTVQGPLHAGAVRLGPGVSSQYASALLLALPLLAGDSTLTLDAPVASAPYLDVTLAVVDAFHLRIDDLPTAPGRRFAIHGGDVPRAAAFAVEGDWSTAAFPFAAAAVTQGRVTVQGLDPDSRQGDRAVLDHLRAFGCRVHEGAGITVEGGPLESPGVLDVAPTPDLFPALCVLAAVAKGTTTFTGGAALRSKESDRIHAMAQGLAGLGIRTEERPDGLVVHGGTPHGGSVHACDDHRVHMAFRILALAADADVHVDGAASAAVSYPAFHQDLAALTGGPA